MGAKIEIKLFELGKKKFAKLVSYIIYYISYKITSNTIYH